MLQNATPLRKSAPWPPNISDEHASYTILYCACHAKCIFPDPLQMSHACHRFWHCYETLMFYSLLARRRIPCACHVKPHLKIEKWSEHVVFLTFWLQNVLLATTACAFSTYQLPKVVRTWCVLYIWTSKCASRHHGVQFSSLIWPHGSAPAALASLLFDPLEPQIIGKTQCFATLLPFRAPASSFFSFSLFSDLSLLLFSSLTLPISAFHLSILSEAWLLNFLRILFVFAFFYFLEFVLEWVDCFFQLFFDMFLFFENFSVFFARIETFRSSPLRSIPGLFNDNSNLYLVKCIEHGIS